MNAHAYGNSTAATLTDKQVEQLEAVVALGRRVRYFKNEIERFDSNRSAHREALVSQLAKAESDFNAATVKVPARVRS